TPGGPSRCGRACRRGRARSGSRRPAPAPRWRAWPTGTARGSRPPRRPARPRRRWPCSTRPSRWATAAPPPPAPRTLSPRSARAPTSGSCSTTWPSRPTRSPPPGRHDRTEPPLEQAVLADFIDGGHFARHIRQMRTLYAERQGAVVDSAHAELSGAVEIPAAEAGLHLVARAVGASQEAILAAASGGGVEYHP